MDLKKINDYWQSNRLLCSIAMAAVLMTLFEIIPKVIMFLIYVGILSVIIYFVPQIINYLKKWLPIN